MFAVGDSLGYCRFNTKLFNSPTLPDFDDFAPLVKEITGIDLKPGEFDEIGRNISLLEHLINFRIGLRGKDDTLPARWFDEPITVGPFKGEKIDRAEFMKLKGRFYELTGLNSESAPNAEWHEKLAKTLTGFAIRVKLPKVMPGAPEKLVVIDEPVANVTELRRTLKIMLPEAANDLDDQNINIAVNGDLKLSGEAGANLRSGDVVELIPIIGGG
jgi:aldehyde:ferredoxin oxidoreductase